MSCKSSFVQNWQSRKRMICFYLTLFEVGTVLFLLLLILKPVVHIYRLQLYVNSTPLIVAWGPYYGHVPIKNILKPLRKCNYKCGLINRTDMASYGREPSAYIIHPLLMNVFDLPEVHPGRLIVLLSLEAPPYASIEMFKVPPDYFNATITYRRDSHYFHPYGHLEPLQTLLPDSEVITRHQINKALSSKSRGSLLFISHCKSDSRREFIIQELSRYTEITVGGKCEKMWKEMFGADVSYLSRSRFTDAELISTHRFYISFENSVCKDYITEKFFLRLSQLLVPVVLKRSIYEDASLPSHSFIALDDFATVQQLGEFLNYLRRNDSAYLRYFEWTKFYAKPVVFRSDVLCKLCQDIHLKKSVVVNDMVKYYIKDQCLGSDMAAYYVPKHRKEIFDSDRESDLYVESLFRGLRLNPGFLYTRNRLKFIRGNNQSSIEDS